MMTQIESMVEIGFHLGCEKSKKIERERAAIGRRRPQGILLYRGCSQEAWPAMVNPMNGDEDGEDELLLLCGLPLSPRPLVPPPHAPT